MMESCVRPPKVIHPVPGKSKKQQVPAGVQLVCGKAVSAVRRTDVSRENLPTVPIVLARLELDLAGYVKPLVSLDFYTMIEVRDTFRAGETRTIGLILNFALQRECNGSKQTLKTYQFVVNIGLLSDGDKYAFRDSFYFVFCDEHACDHDCCLYTMELAGIEVIGPGANAEDINRLLELNIEDSVLKALIQETVKLHAGGVKQCKNTATAGQDVERA
ncbi:MAG TPA: DUF4489 domain-containing protein [Firmicutes bacterium]|nr:DUF4489 domain-containing protein [Bacillota bacterium]